MIILLLDKVCGLDMLLPLVDITCRKKYSPDFGILAVSGQQNSAAWSGDGLGQSADCHQKGNDWPVDSGLMIV